MSISIIGKDGVTPESVLAIEMDRVSEAKGLIIVSFGKDGNNHLSCSCSLGDLPTAQAMLLEHWLDIRAGKIAARMEN